jgi:folate-dependent phosphoribosylglycinamide formyltransferase PurN
VEAVYAALRDWAPDFLVATGFHVLPPHAVTIPGQAALNFHPSYLAARLLEKFNHQ